MKKISKLFFSVLLLSLLFSIIVLIPNTINFFDDEYRDYNVIIISIDTLRADHLGVYGYHRNTTPNLDKFAGESIVFENAYSQAVWTLPSHASVFTSLYPEVHGLIGHEFKLNESHITLAEVLKNNGYVTAAFVGGNSGGGDLNKRFGFSQGFDVYIDDAGLSFNDTIPLAQEWMDKNRDQKFFLFFHGYDVHDPYFHPKNFDHRFDENYNGIIDSLITEIGQIVTLQKLGEDFFIPFGGEKILIEEKDINHILAHYDGGIIYTDYLLSDFIESNNDLLDNTIIILFSDHGETLLDHHYSSNIDDEFQANRVIGHGDVYDEVIHVPLIIKHPNKQTARIQSLVQLIDVYPTILDFLDIKANMTLQGKSIIPLIIDKKEINQHIFSDGFANRQAIRTLKWKLITTGQLSSELYDLENDPKEQENVIDKYPDVVKDLENEILELKLKNYNFLTRLGSNPEPLRKFYLELLYPFFAVNVSKKKIGSHQITEIIGNNQNRTLRYKIISNMNNEVADSYIRDRIVGINSLFVSKPAPYPGVVTKITQCPEQFHPHFYEANTLEKYTAYYIINANDRFTYGICSPDLIKYKTMLAFIYCRKLKDLHQIEIFVPVTEFDEEEYRKEIESAYC